MRTSENELSSSVSTNRGVYILSKDLQDSTGYLWNVSLDEVTEFWSSIKSHIVHRIRCAQCNRIRDSTQSMAAGEAEARTLPQHCAPRTFPLMVNSYTVHVNRVLLVIVEVIKY